jgi:hypothetical protein
MKSIVVGLSTAALLIGFAGAASAAPGKYQGHRVTPYERAEIDRSAARVAQVKRQAWRDGRLSPVERVRIRIAEAQHRAIVARAYR